MEKNLKIIMDSLKDSKAENIIATDVEHLTDMMSYIVIATATSTTHCNATARHLESVLKDNNIEIIGIEGYKKNDWILVDTGDIVVHIMHQYTRDFYQLEKLWTPT